MIDPSGCRAGRPSRTRVVRAAAFTLVLVGAVLAFVGIASAIDEVEPNGNLTAAQVVPGNGSYSIRGNTSAATDAADYFQWNLTAASVVEVIATSGWGCTGAACENLTVWGANGTPLIDPFGDPMGGSDVYFSGLAGSHWFLKVSAGSPGGAYSLSVIVHPFNYRSGQYVDIAAANASSAIVYLTWAPDKSSPEPYDLDSEGLGVYYGLALKISIVNAGPLNLSVGLPAGLMWAANDSRYTDYLVTRDQYIALPAWSYDTVSFVAASLSPYAWVPGDPSHPRPSPNYYVGSRAAGELDRIITETDDTHYDYQAEQIAVWAWTAGQNSADFDRLGASTSAKNEAINILNRANVHTAINPTPGRLFPLIDDLFGAFPFWVLCFFFLFLGIPFIVGISQAMRVMRLKNMQIDGAFGPSPFAARQQRRERREETRRREREARDMERQRHQQRLQEEAQARAQVQLPPPPPFVALPPAVAGPPVPTAASPLTTFLRKDAEERFDLDALNALDYNAVLAEAMKEKAKAAETATKAEAILRRIHADVADPDTIDDILRDRMVKWYRQSPTASDWSANATRWWSGLVAESKAAGGRRRTPLEARLSTLQQACASRGKWIKPKPPKDEAPRGRKGQAPPPPDPVAVKAQTVQAVLDDLAAAAKAADAMMHPLPVLSELAAKLTTQRVNQALAEMFKADVRGPYVILHPSRYPDCDITVIRPPAAAARAGAVAYEVAFARAAGQAPGPQIAGTVQGPPGGMMLELTGAIWDKPSVSTEEWTAVLGELQRSRQKLDPPPGAYRKLPPYFTLRELLIASEEARRTFLSVKWRGKPVGLPLLVQLLIDRSITPEFDTDREYFEAELGDLERGDVNYQSPAGTWTIGTGLQVTRGGDASAGISYKL